MCTHVDRAAGCSHAGSVFHLSVNGLGSTDSVACCRLDGKHVVFGQVVDGIDVVKAMEKCGSNSGKTSKKIAIANCGKL